MRGAKVLVTLQAPGVRTRDSEGRWSEAGSPTIIEGHVAPAQSGYSSRSTTERHVDAGIVLLPAGSPVDTETLVDVSGAKTLADGSYRVEHVTHTRKHLRCLLRRHNPGGS